MEIYKAMNWGELKHEYDLDGKRLLPWDNWDMPFGGAWCVVRSNTHSLKHEHDEQEMFFAVSGCADVHVGEEIFELNKGDMIAIPPGSSHFVENNHSDDFHFYTLWWDSDTCKEYLHKVER